MKLLIAGDSFAADWSKKHPGAQGWPNHVAQHHEVTNCAQAGCSEYRIYQQLRSQNLDDYDVIVISHTSPYRIYTEHNPLRTNDQLHEHCDLLYSDICYHANRHSDYESVRVYFEKFFSLDYAVFCYELTRKEITAMIGARRVIEISHMPVPGHVDIDFSDVWQQHPGSVNHYNVSGNKQVAQRLLGKLQQ